MGPGPRGGTEARNPLNSSVATLAQEARRRVDALLRYLGLRSAESLVDGLNKLAGALVSERSMPSRPAIAEELLDAYSGAEREVRHAFLRSLTQQFPFDPERIDRAIACWQNDRSADTALRLRDASDSQVRKLIEYLNLAPNGTRRLIGMREDLLEMPQDDQTRVLDQEFFAVFSSWFNAGFLDLRRIDWGSPAELLAKIISYEAVHEIADWDDLRRRVAPRDRRCYAFFHPQMPDEPLIFVEVALTAGLPGELADLLDAARQPLELEKVASAIFYSISNCQKGLRGIPFGLFLLKRVIGSIKAELPQVRQFATLSPVPGFAEWLRESGRGHDAGDLRALAAHYIIHEKSRSGAVRDPVARFHIGNGATFEAVHHTSASNRTLTASAHIMVNYVYDPQRIEKNYFAFARSGLVPASRAVKHLAGQIDTKQGESA